LLPAPVFPPGRWFAGLTILLRFFLESLAVVFLSVLFASGFFFLGFSNCFKSIFFPVSLGPSNFLYCVVSFSEFSAKVSESTSTGFAVAFLGGVFLVASFSIAA